MRLVRLATCATLGLLLAACADAEETTTQEAATVAVRRGPLRLVVREGGTLVSPNPVVIKTHAYKKREIIELVDEGSYVTKGQVVCRLQSDDLEDALVKYERRVDRARSNLRQAEENYAIRQKLNLEALKAAETKLLLAQRAHDAYLEGTMPLERKRLESALTVAREELKRAETEHEASKRLHAREIIPQTQLEADELGRKKALERVVIAEGNLSHFNDFASRDEVKRLRSTLDVATIAHERTKQECRSQLAQVRDLLETRQKNLANELEIHGKVVKHIGYCTIRSPADGLIVYARRRGWDKEEPISLGRWVWQGETLLRIPDLSTMAVELDIHESQVKRITKGQRATVSVDALPGQSFPGTVKRVAPVPSSKSSWMNPDLKVYEADVALDHAVDGIRPGMHADVEILISDEQDVLQIPVEAVLQSGAQSYVYVAGGSTPELRQIGVGPNNQRAVEVVQGLQEGERVYLAPPQGAPPIPGPEARAFLRPAGAMTENGG